MLPTAPLVDAVTWLGDITTFPYSPDIVLSNMQVFGQLNEFVEDQSFSSNADLWRQLQYNDKRSMSVASKY